MANVRNIIEILLTAKNQLTAPVRSAGAALQKFHGQITAVSTGFLAFRQVAQDAVGALDAIVGQTIRGAREFQAFEHRLGISAATLSELKYVAELNNVQFSQLAIGMQRMTRRVAEAAQGLGEARGAIKELGLDAAELNKLPLEQQFEAVADALSGVQAQSDRVRLAFKLFDSEGVSLLQTMRGGADEMRRLRQEARETGAAMSDDMIRNADEAARKFKQLQGAITGVKNAIAEGILAEISEQDISNLTNMFRSVAAIAGTVTTISLDVGKGTLEALKTIRGLIAAGAALDLGILPEIEAVIDRFENLGKKQERMVDLTDDQKQRLIALGLVVDEQAEARRRHAEEYSVWLADQNAKLEQQIVYQRDGVWYLRQAGDEAAELARNVIDTSDGTSAWQQHLEAAGIRLDGIRTRIQLNTEATRQWRAEMEAAFKPTPVQEFMLEAERLERVFDETLLAAVGTFADHLGAAMSRALVYTKRFHEAAKEAWKSFIAAVIAEINRMIARQVIAAALSIFTGGGSITALTRGVKEAVGAAEGGFQHGGIVPGYGAGDTQLIRAQPGEAVLPKELTAFLLRAARQPYSFVEPAMAYAYQPPRQPTTINIFAQTILGGRAEALELARTIAAYQREAGAMA